MNKIYKVIWSKVRNCYVAVSEIAKRNGKSCTSVNCGARSLRMSAVALGVTAALFAGSSCFGTPAAWAASSGNSVEVTTGNPYYVYGGYANSTEPDPSRIVGGYSTTVTDAADSNTVTIGGVNVNNRVFGGYSAGGNANLNNLTINSGATIGEQVFGGNSGDYGNGNADQNKVTINGGQFDAEVNGGYSLKGNARDNQVIINGGTLKSAESVYGGQVGTGNATGNIVNISQSSTEVLTTINGTVYGGYTYSGAAGGTTKEEGNKVIISSGTVTGQVHGGYAKGTGTVAFNTVTINDGKVGGEIYAGYSYGGSAVFSNTAIVNNGEVGWVNGGYSSTGGTVGGDTEEKGNKVIINGGKVSVPCGGYASGNGTTARFNTVTVNGGNIGLIYGGYSNNLTRDNKVTINSGTIDQNVYGGYASGGEVSTLFNTVTVNGGVISGQVYGGYAFSGNGDAKGNKVDISQSSTEVLTRVVGSVYGGYSDITGNVGGTGEGEGNTVTVSGGNVNGKIYGGYLNAGNGNVIANAVIVNNGNNISVSSISGGSSKAATGNVEDNKVTITGVNYYSVIGGDLYNTDSTGNVKGNIVTVSDTTGTFVLGGRSTGAGDVAGNIVTINGGTVLGGVYGGDSSKGNANENEVTIKGGTINNYVYGGYAGGNANSNTITISGNAAVKGQIYGGYSNGDVYYADGTPSTADGNTITISGSPDLSTAIICAGNAYTSAQNNTINILSPVTVRSLVGGIKQTTGTVAGNTLNVAAKNVTTGGVSGFQNMNFYLPEDIAKDNTMLTVSSGSATNVEGVTFGVAALSGVNLQKGDTVNLLVNSNGLTTDDTLKTTDSATLAKAEFLSANSLTTDNKYELGISKKGEDTIIATVDNVTEQSADTGGDTSAVEEIKKSPVETRMGVVTMVNAGADLLAGQGMANAADAAAAERSADGGVAAARAGGFAPFAAVGLGNLRAKSGSHVDTKSIGLSLGFAREIENKSGKLLVGPVVEYGHGKYDSYQDNGITADGKSSYWGIGVIAKQTNHNGFYYEGSLRAGRTKSDYGSDSARPGNHVSYDSSATYWAAHLGAGKLFDMGHDNTLDVYGKYFYSHTGSDSTTIHIGAASEGVDFSAVNSHRLRIGTRLTHALNAKNKIYGGLAWQYEFNGDARAVYSVSGEAPSPSVKGSSGMLELGWQVKPGKSPMTIDLGVTGWVGKLRGVAANVQMNWTF